MTRFCFVRRARRIFAKVRRPRKKLLLQSENYYEGSSINVIASSGRNLMTETMAIVMRIQNNKVVYLNIPTMVDGKTMECVFVNL